MRSRVLIIAALILCAILLVGRHKIESALTNPQFWYSGTVRAVEACMQQPGNDLVSKEVMRRLCAARHSRTSAYLDAELSSVAASGAAPTANLTLTIYNSTPDLIVTSATVVVTLKDGKQDAGHGTVKNLWLEPGDRQSVPVLLDKEFPPRDAAGNSTLAWYFTDVRAVRIGD